ncbi:MAG: hypothetical protein OEZ06_30635 [Myxococcales bacterium]|nr:hypothetical protein [Myxococcales bacterium]
MESSVGARSRGWRGGGLWAPLLLLALVAACTPSDRFQDGVPGAGGGAGGSSSGGGSRGDGEFGAGCDKTSDCKEGLVCDQEIDLSLPVEGLPGGLRDVPSSVFPGGLCTPVGANLYDPTGATSCDPLPGQLAQGCGEDGACVVVPVGSSESLVACRPVCDPTAEDGGCGGRFGYTCDFSDQACVEGCQSDEECRLWMLDSDGDGRADTRAYDDASEAVCDTQSFRCVHHGGTGAATGDSCQRMDDCEDEGDCIEPTSTFGGLDFPGGYCTKLGCSYGGRECAGQNAVCARLRPWSVGRVTTEVCLVGCTVGAEPEADRTGTAGHGEGCREGYRCHYNGGSGDEGVCVGGNYNDVSDNNLGSACDDDSDCYSPFGLGRCMNLAVGGVVPESAVCAIMDCHVPGIPEDVCGENAACIGLNGDMAFCVRECKVAEDCAAGYACADDDLDPGTAKICYSACFEDADCRADSEVCGFVAGQSYGSCIAS